ncbi:serine/threonine protein kinase [Bacillus toyonensis]|uniref:serine/threonine-protein kinase n=1 Tax=Bacillus toyonensis TaxID=155322 RepID=UPI000BFC2F85|nr:serine/threonine-protein kinase [Bacillus toyonensis]PHE64187.1 serine/threonine protein kinase [Bacillus toyonensis]
MTLKTGDVIEGKYKVLDQVGKGGMATVYLTMDLRLNKQWAIKEIIKNDSKMGRVEYKSLLVEAEILKKLDHNNLPRIVDIIDSTDKVFIVMDYLEGKNLQEIIMASEKGIPQENVIRWGKQLATVLGYLHNRKPSIIYRDMKPSNVMLQPNGTLKLFDFGISREITDNKINMTVALGTKGYAAPEQYGSNPWSDERSDIYSLGMTLYHLVTGHNPADSPEEIKPITQWDASLSKGLEKIISKMTKYNPSERYQSTAELIYDLDHYAELDSEYTNKLKGKFRTLLVLGTLTVCSFVASGVGYYANAMEVKDKYASTYQQAEVTQDPKVTIQAIGYNPTKIEAYNLLINQYKLDAVFSLDEEKELLKTINPNLVELQKQEGYGDLAFEIGKLYWYYYAGDKSNDDTSLTRVTTPIKWFDDAVKYNARNTKTAKVFSEIGKFQRDIVLNMQEASDSKLYSKYWGNIKEVLSMNEHNDLVNLEVGKMVFDAIETYAVQLKNDGIKNSEMQQVAEKVTKSIKAINPKTDKTTTMKNNLMSRVDSVRDKIANAYRTDS